MKTPQTQRALGAWATLSLVWFVCTESAFAQEHKRAFSNEGFKEKVGGEAKPSISPELHANRAFATNLRRSLQPNLVDFSTGTQIATVTCAPGACNNTNIINWVEFRPATGGNK